MGPTREHKVKCHACGSHTRTLTIANPAFWRKYKYDSIEVHGSYSSSLDTGQVRSATIDGVKYQFLRSEVKKDWPELDKMFSREDSCI